MTAEINDRAQESPAERDQRFASLMEAEVLAGYRRATYLGIPLVMGFGILDLLSLASKGIGELVEKQKQALA